MAISEEGDLSKGSKRRSEASRNRVSSSLSSEAMENDSIVELIKTKYSFIDFVKLVDIRKTFKQDHLSVIPIELFRMFFSMLVGNEQPVWKCESEKPEVISKVSELNDMEHETIIAKCAVALIQKCKKLAGCLDVNDPNTRFENFLISEKDTITYEELYFLRMTYEYGQHTKRERDIEFINILE